MALGPIYNDYYNKIDNVPFHVLKEKKKRTEQKKILFSGCVIIYIFVDQLKYEANINRYNQAWLHAK